MRQDCGELATFRAAQLDRSNFAAFRQRILATEQAGVAHEARSYPGYPRILLDEVVARRRPSLDQALQRRRSVRSLGSQQMTRTALSRLLYFAHGVHATRDRGPVPSSGGLQSLELYVVAFTTGWLPTGLYHYDRRAHALSCLREGAQRSGWCDRIPSMAQFDGGALLWVLVGDGARIEAKYGLRGKRFLSLEAGHLMQNLCLLSDTLGLCTLPLGGFFEDELARAFVLPETDEVLYVGACGEVVEVD